MGFPVVMYGCESWTVKKVERQRIDAFELWCWRRLLRVPWINWCFSSVQFSRSVMSNSLQPHGLRTPGLPVQHQLLEFTQTHVHELVMPSNHLVLCHLLLSHLQSFPASGSFPMSQFFASGGQSIGVSVSASVLPMNIQDLFPLGLTGLIGIDCSPKNSH